MPQLPWTEQADGALPAKNALAWEPHPAQSEEIEVIDHEVDVSTTNQPRPKSAHNADTAQLSARHTGAGSGRHCRQIANSNRLAASTKVLRSMAGDTMRSTSA